MANRADTFDRANGSLNGSTPSDGGAAWVSNGFDIASNAATTNGAGVKSALLESSLAECDVQYTLATVLSNAGMLFRHDGSGNGLGLYTINNYVHLIKRSGGSVTQDPLSDGSGTSTWDNPVSNGDVFKVNLTGNTITVYINGVQRIQRTGVTYGNTATQHGLYNDASNSPVWEDFSIAAVASMACDRANVLCGSGTVVVALAGSGTAWDGTTVFTLTGGLTGWSAASYNVTSATDATITLNKGSGTGTLTITESVTGTTADTLTATNTATAVADGDWAVPSVWDVLEVPAATNNATAPATFDLSVTDTRSIAVLSVSGSVTVQSGGVLTIKDNSVVANGTLQVGEAAGPGTLNIDGGKHLDLGSAANQTGTWLKARAATSAAKSVIRTTSGTEGSGHAYIDSPYLDSGNLDIEDVTFVNFGDTSTPKPAIALQYDNDATTFLCSRLIFDAGSGDLKFGSTLASDMGLSVIDCTFKNPAGTGLYVSGDVAADVGVARDIKGCVFYGQPRLPDNNAVVDECVFHEAFGTAGTAGRLSSLNRSLIRCVTNTSLSRKGDWGYGYLVGDGSTYDGNGRYSSYDDLTNWHATTPGSAAAGEYVVSYTMVEGWGIKNDSGQAGGPDEFIPTGDVDYSPDSTNTSYWHHNVGIPYDLDTTLVADGLPGGAGTLVTCLTSTGNKYEHNTWFNAHQGMIALAESVTGNADMVTSLKSNLAWNSAGRQDTGAYNTLVYSSNPSYLSTPSLMPADMISSGAADYNGRWNLNDLLNFAGAPAYQYKKGGGSTTPGAHDVEGDPQFRDPAARFWRWVLGLTGVTIPAPASGGSPLSPDVTTADGRKDYCAWGLYKLSLVNEPGHADFDPAFTLDAYRAYIFAAFAPQNPIYQNAGHDGQTIGALPFAALPAAVWQLRA